MIVAYKIEIFTDLLVIISTDFTMQNNNKASSFTT